MSDRRGAISSLQNLYFTIVGGQHSPKLIINAKHHQFEFSFTTQLNLCVHNVSTYVHNIPNRRVFSMPKISRITSFNVISVNLVYPHPRDGLDCSVHMC